MFLCFCQLALEPLLGPYPQAYTASQLRSLRRAPGRLDHRPVQIVGYWAPVTQKWAGVTPLPAAGAFAYLPPLSSAEGLAYLEQLQPVVDLHAHGPVVIAQPPELSTNKSGKTSSNLIKIDNYDSSL